MKTRNIPLRMAVLLAANVLLIAGCNAGSAESKQTANDPLAMQPAPAVPQLPPLIVTSDPLKVGQPDAIMVLPSPPVLPADFKSSTNLADVIKLVRAGVSDNLLRTFITQRDNPFDLGAAGIIYLHDLGLSDELINLMLQHDNQPPLVVQSTVTNAPALQPAPDSASGIISEQPVPTPTDIVVEPPAPVAVNYFYSTLSPYGMWIEVDGYGRCWQPTVVLAQPGWQPYCDNGRWVYSSYGWYWSSGYSWGSTFHYGRWFNHPRRGWCWMPDNVWGPAWVSWRESSDYCGWAPLPPHATWVTGVGLTFRGSVVGVGFDFGLPSHCYTFVPRSRFGERHPRDHALPHSQVSQVINHTTVINNYTLARHGGAFNRGFVIGNDPAGRRSPDANRSLGEPPHPLNHPAPTGQLENNRTPDSPVITSPAVVAPAPGPAHQLSSGQGRPGSADNNSHRHQTGGAAALPAKLSQSVQPRLTAGTRPVSPVNPPWGEPAVSQPGQTLQPLVIGRGHNDPRGNSEGGFTSQRHPPTSRNQPQDNRIPVSPVTTSPAVVTPTSVPSKSLSLVQGQPRSADYNSHRYHSGNTAALPPNMSQIGQPRSTAGTRPVQPIDPPGGGPAVPQLSQTQQPVVTRNTQSYPWGRVQNDSPSHSKINREVYQRVPYVPPQNPQKSPAVRRLETGHFVNSQAVTPMPGGQLVVPPPQVARARPEPISTFTPPVFKAPKGRVDQSDRTDLNQQTGEKTGGWQDMSRH